MSLIERARSTLLGAPLPLPESFPRREIPDGVEVRSGRIIPGIGGLLARLGGPAAAVALRRTIVVHPDARLTPGLLAHEMEHVRQWSEDPLFPLRYTLATLRHGYRDNPYEVAARAAAQAAAHPPPLEDPS